MLMLHVDVSANVFTKRGWKQTHLKMIFPKNIISPCCWLSPTPVAALPKLACQLHKPKAGPKPFATTRRLLSWVQCSNFQLVKITQILISIKFGWKKVLIVCPAAIYFVWTRVHIIFLEFSPCCGFLSWDQRPRPSTQGYLMWNLLKHTCDSNLINPIKSLVKMCVSDNFESNSSQSVISFKFDSLEDIFRIHRWSARLCAEIKRLFSRLRRRRWWWKINVCRCLHRWTRGPIRRRRGW